MSEKRPSDLFASFGVTKATRGPTPGSRNMVGEQHLETITQLSRNKKRAGNREGFLVPCSEFIVLDKREDKYDAIKRKNLKRHVQRWIDDRSGEGWEMEAIDIGYLVSRPVKK